MAVMVCLANSYRPGGHCIAGKLLGPEGFSLWLRPVSPRPTAELQASECQYASRQTPRLLDLIHLTLDRSHPQGHQTENVIVQTGKPWRKLGTVDHEAVSSLCDHPPTLWTLFDQTRAGRYNCVAEADAATLSSSLCLIEVQDLTLRVVDSPANEIRAHYGVFFYQGLQYVLRVTDPQAFAAMMGQLPGDHPIGHAFSASASPISMTKTIAAINSSQASSPARSSENAAARIHHRPLQPPRRTLPRSPAAAWNPGRSRRALRPL